MTHWQLHLVVVQWEVQLQGVDDETRTVVSPDQLGGTRHERFGNAAYNDELIQFGTP